MHPKQALSRILAESEASNVDFEDTEGFSLQDPGPLVLHRGSQCNIKCLQRSSAVQVKAEMVSVGTQTEWFEQQISTPLPSAVQSEDESSSDVMNQSDLSWIPDEEMSSESSDEENPEAPIQESLNDPNVADKFIVCLSQLIVVIVYHLLGLLWGNPGTNRVPGKDLHKNQAVCNLLLSGAIHFSGCMATQTSSGSCSASVQALFSAISASTQFLPSYRPGRKSREGSSES
ncbi:uncharacterized protein LOC144519589 isoform X3 [Sander vitreus]